MKEAYDKMSSKTKQFIDVSRKDADTKRILEATLEAKQNSINKYLDTIALLKQELVETERVNKKLISYSSSSYVLDHIFQKQPKESETEEQGVGNGKESRYHQVPPPTMENYCQKKFKGVEMTLNIKKPVQNPIDQFFPDDIDVTYTKSDVCELLVNDVVEKFLLMKNKITKNESEECFHKNYLKNSKSDSQKNDDPIMMMYKMVGSDKLFSHDEFSIQNVNLDKLE
ncbi:hypothetical protein Hanom_Chr07g00616431 [Helianthus anomalus]